MATVTDLGSTDTSASGAVTSITHTGVTAATGDVLAVLISIQDPFDAETVSGVAWSGESFSDGETLKGSGSPGSWYASGIWFLVVASGDTADVVVSFTGSVSEAQITVVKLTGVDTSGSPIRSTAEEETAQASPPNGSFDMDVTGTVAADLVLSCVSTSAEGANTRVNAQAGMTELYNSFATYTEGRGVHAYKAAAGTTVNVGYDCLNNIDLSERPYSAHVAVAFKAAGGGGGGSSIVPILNTRKFFGA